ncbi:MAG TPA: amidophosphoribosyltransferase [Phycisphaerales bacterium]|nr:amidophosphoribosyltransferase [Phycisphaerales bacterium]
MPTQPRHDTPLALPVLSDGPEAREKCGIFGVWGAPSPARLAYFGLMALQHRGQESAGIVTTDGEKHHRHVDMGLVAHIFSAATLNALDEAAHARTKTGKPPGGAIGHNRYSTTGASLLANAQPFVGYYKGGPIAIGHNGNVVNAAELRRELEEAGHAFSTTSDTEVILQLVAASSADATDALGAAMAKLRGAFSLVFLFNDRVEAVRDPWGWRPLSIGKLPDGSHVIASETIALDVVGATYVREVEPGEVVTLSDKGMASRRYAEPAKRLAHCVFEHVYFASPASRLFGRNVELTREKLGERLALEAPAVVDMVVPMPDSGRSAATGYARASKIPYREAIIPNRYVGRTFIKPSNEERQAAVRLKLSIIGEIIAGKKLVVVDDSIVRGTTTRAKMDQLRAAGAKEIHLRISSPPIRHPCYFGIDFPHPDQLIAHGRDEEEIRAHLGVDSLRYLSVEGLLEVVGSPTVPSSAYCSACFSGDYPITVNGELTKDVLAKNC